MFTTLDKSYSFVYNTSRRDLLTSLTYNDGTSEAFNYDGLGNPIVYRGKILHWSNVNQLTNYNGNTFTYDGTGKRISKNGTTYFYAGDKLIKEIRPNNVTSFVLSPIPVGRLIGGTLALIGASI